MTPDEQIVTELLYMVKRDKLAHNLDLLLNRWVTMLFRWKGRQRAEGRRQWCMVGRQAIGWRRWSISFLGAWFKKKRWFKFWTGGFLEYFLEEVIICIERFCLEYFWATLSLTFGVFSNTVFVRWPPPCLNPFPMSTFGSNNKPSWSKLRWGYTLVHSLVDPVLYWSHLLTIRTHMRTTKTW